MNRKQKPIPKQPRPKPSQRDPRYASVRPWDWRLCRDCGHLIPKCCSRCGGTHFTERPGEIIAAALRQHGYPPRVLRASRTPEAKR